MDILKDTEQIIEKVKNTILESSTNTNSDLNAFCDLIQTYSDLLNFFAVKIQADNSIFKLAEEETKYIKIPLSAITDCRGFNVERTLENSSLAERINYIKSNFNGVSDLA